MFNGVAKRWGKRRLCREKPHPRWALVAGPGSAVPLAGILQHPLFLVPANTAKQYWF